MPDMNPSRWTVLNLCAIAALVVGAVGGISAWYLFSVERGLAFPLAAVAALLLIGWGVRMQLRLRSAQVEELGLPEGTGDGEEESRLSLAGRFAVAMLAWVYPNVGSTDYAYSPPRWVMLAAPALVAALLLAAAALFRGQDDVWTGCAAGVVLAVVALFLLVLGLLPRRLYERDASLRRFLADVGFRSVLGVRLFALLVACVLITLLVAVIRCR